MTRIKGLWAWGSNRREPLSHREYWVRYGLIGAFCISGVVATVILDLEGMPFVVGVFVAYVLIDTVLSTNFLIQANRLRDQVRELGAEPRE